MVFEVFPAFDFDGPQDAYIPLWDEQLPVEEEDEAAIKGHQTHYGETDDYPDFDSFTSDLGSFYAEKSVDHLRPLSELLVPDSQQIDVATKASFQELLAGLEYNQNTQFSVPALESKENKANPISRTSLEILNSFRTGNRMPTTAQESAPRRAAAGGKRRSSTVEILRTAGARYIQQVEKTEDDLSALIRFPFNSLFSGHATDETRGIHLAYVLLSSAEKIHNRQFDRASRLLEQCEALASHTGDAVQRVVSYFAIALRERINGETGRTATKGSGGRCCRNEMEEGLLNPSSALLACHQQLPFSRVMQFTSIQAIIDSVASASRVHLVDLNINIGLQSSILMHALAERKAARPVQLLKITAVGTSAERIAETGKRLAAFAQTLSLPFRFKAVVVAHMHDLQAGMVEVEADEAVAVHAPIVLSTMIVQAECLENVMRVVRALKPCVMSVVEVEANHNSSSFVNRFTEALFFFSAWFDCVDACMEREDCDRLTIEGSYLFTGIRSIVAAEGGERVVRHVKLEVWRAYFRRFGFVEAELSELSLYQAKLLVKQSGCGNRFMFEKDGKGLVIGWKGTPLQCVSAWKLR
ncbi:hypothetical protein ACLOJK_026478 [Asimina triloba]